MVHLSLTVLAKSINQRLRRPNWRHAATKRAARSRSFRPALEALEDRSLPSTAPVLTGVNAAVGEVGHHHRSAPSVVITSPTAGAAVERYVTITGQLENAGHRWPVVLVQPVLAGEPWYVQPQVLTVNADGTFTDQIYVGNASTPAGMSFRIEVILAANKHEATHRFAEGTTLKHLPKDLTASPVVVVTHASPPPVIVRA